MTPNPELKENEKRIDEITDELMMFFSEKKIMPHEAITGMVNLIALIDISKQIDSDFLIKTLEATLKFARTVK